MSYFDQAWFLLLAFTVATLLVLVLRRPLRHLFGSVNAFQLWLLPVVAMLVSQLPHKTVVQFVELSQMTQALAPATNALAQTSNGSAVDWRVIVLMIWVAGTIVRAGASAWKQSRYRHRLKDATKLETPASRWPIVQARNADIGPALVGAWRPRIVLPVDFQNRYDAAERMLILAHETMHARRRDSWWSLLAEIIVAVFWFHPLAWLALAAFHHDQELACDAAVLAEHGAQRRTYANAMLKTQTGVIPLPVGCSWSSRHPLTERISMLKQPAPGRLASRTFRIAVVALASALSLAVYAGSSSAPAALLANELQLNMTIDFQTQDTTHTIDDKAKLALCVKPGETGTIKSRDWNIEATATPRNGDIVTRLSVTDIRRESASPAIEVISQLGDTVSWIKDAPDRKTNLYNVHVTALAGCVGAYNNTAGSITQNVKDTSAQVAANMIAAKAGFELENASALGDGKLAFNFQDIPAPIALQLVAKVAGMNAVFDGKKVRFVPA